MRIKLRAHGACAVSVMLMLSACGDGGDGADPLSSNPSPPSSSPQPQNPLSGVGSGLSLATNTVTFSTNNRNYTPPNQFIATTLDYTGADPLRVNGGLSYKEV